jgi:hypothetical protein
MPEWRPLALPPMMATSPPIRRFQIRGETGLAYHHISHVPGLDDRNSLAFEGLAFEAKYR